jgi:hypothetical protein
MIRAEVWRQPEALGDDALTTVRLHGEPRPVYPDSYRLSVASTPGALGHFRTHALQQR